MSGTVEISPAPVRIQRVPATFAQQRLWFLEQLQPGNLAYLIAWKIRLSGDLHADALERTLNEIVRRHKVFRTTFAEVQSDVFQLVASALTIPLTRVDLSNESDAESAAERLAQEEAQRPLDLGKGPLLRATLLRLGEREHVLLLTLHHIIFDGSSRGIFMRELTGIYDAFREGRPSPLPEPRVQYADYAVWQRRSLQGKRYEKLLEYWKTQLAGAPPVLELPTDRPRPALESFHGAKKAFTLPTKLSAKVNLLARARGSSVFMLTMAAFQTLLAKYSGQDDILVGIPVAGRVRTEFEELIGFFANQMVMRLRFTAESTFDDLIAQIKDVSFDAFEHQEMPLDRLVQELNPERSLSHNPLFQVVFSLRNFKEKELRLAGIEKAEFSATVGDVSKFDLSMFLSESGSELSGRVEYNTDLFDEQTIERMVEHYKVLLGRLVDEPGRKVSEISLLSDVERQRMLVEWNRSEFDYPRDLCLHEVIEAQVTRTPESRAAVFEGTEISYRELNAEANRLARLLRARSVRPRDRVAVHMERSLAMLTALLAVQKCGAAYVPLDPSHSAERLRLVLEDADVACLVTHDATTECMPGYCRAVLHLERDAKAIAVESADNLERSIGPDDLINVIFTSGSTGRPKGVEVPHRGIVNALTWMCRTFEMGPKDVTVAVSNYAFDMSLTELFGPLMTGGTVLLASQHVAVNGEELAALMTAYKATVTIATPTTLGMLLEAGFTFDGMTILSGGEALSRELIRRVVTGAKLYNGYGPTETSLFSTCHRFMDAQERIAVGKPMGNTQVYVLDRNLQPVPVGVEGDIYIAGDGVTRGYLNRPELTAEKFIANPFRSDSRLYLTGDVGRWGATGDLDYLGRADHQVKIRGFRIELGEIESVLAQHDAVRECVVIAREDEPGNKFLAAYIVPMQPDAPLDLAALRTFLREHLPEYMIPRGWVVLDQLPLSANGKMDRKALPVPEFEMSSAPAGEFVDPVEEMIAGIWTEVLKTHEIGSESNFFDLGGHSLLATRVAALIRQAFRVELPLRAVFEDVTLSRLAARVRTLVREGRGEAVPPIVPAPPNEPVPLSYAQQRLWFLAQMEPENSFYNVPWGLRLTGLLDVPALTRALVEITARHDALRTHFEAGDEEPREIIAASVELPLRIVDLSEMPESEREAEALRLAGEDGERLFTLSEGPLFRVLLVTLSDNDHLFLMTLHHAITDGWSQGVLANELAALYEAFHAGRESPLAALVVGYADYAVWQRRYLDRGGALAPQMRYWHSKLAGAPEALDLPTDRSRLPVQSFRGAKEVVFLPEELLDGLKALSRNEGTTLFITLLAAFNVLLSRYAGQQDVVVGTAIAGRHHAETERIVGLFTNTLALRTDLSGEPSFRELLRRVRETTLDAYVNQDAPFEKLVEELNPERDLSRSPIFQVMLVLVNVPPTTRNLSDVEARSFSVQKQSSKFDLSLYASEQPEGLRTSFEYNTDLFDTSTIERMTRHFRRILEAVVAEPELEVSQVPMLTEDEEQNLLVTWNDTRREYPRDLKLAQIFETQAERSPDARACVSGDDSLTYAELNERSNQLAHYLMSRGVGAGELVGVCLSRTNDLVVALLGIMKTGAAYLPLDPHYPQERLSYILEDAKTRLVVTEEAVREMVPAFEGEAVCMESHGAEIAGHSKSNPAVVGGPEDLAYVLHTSGSTGKPKGVEITHRNLVNFLWTMLDEPGLNAEDTLLAVTTLSFDISGLELYLPLVTGACVVIASRPETMDAADLMRLMSRWGVSVMQATPATWQMLLEAGWKGDAGLKILCGGEALPTDLAAKLVASCPELWNMYGPTETTIWSSVSRIEPGNVGRITVGRPIANTTMYVLDEKRQLVPVGVAGELYIGGDGVGRGYWGKPELTAERFVADPFAPGMRLYRTGDLAKFLPDGTIQVVGRIDFQVKVRGHRIELGEIETVLAQSEAVVECVVVVREDVPGDKRLVGYVVGRADAGLMAADLRRQVAERLPEYMVPSAIVLLEALPRTANGKIDRKALPAPDVQESGPAYVAPRGLTEEIVCEIWAEVLKLERVGAEDNFFHLGGHSLLATRVVARIRQAMGVEVPLAALFESPTVSGLAERIAGLSRDGLARAMPKMLKVAEGVPLPLSYAQQRLWFLDQFEPDSPFYNVPWAVRLSGGLDEAALERALVELMARHEALRTSFVVDGAGGEPVQVVSDALDLPLTRVGLGALPEDERLGEAIRLVRDEARRPFRLSEGPLFRVLLVTLDAQDHVLLVTLHHAISDGWSLGVLAEELASLYEAFRAGEPSPLPALALQYRDFSAWQREYLAGGALEEQLDYWTRHLADAPPSIELPTDRPRPSVQTFEGAKRVAIVPAETLAPLKALGRREGATLFITLLAAFDVLLSRYSGQQDLVIGTAIAGRETPETEKLIGFFANTLALRADLSGEPTFVELLRRVRATTLASYAHASLPFEKLVEELNPVRDMSRSPIFQVMFILQNAFERASMFGSLGAEAFAAAESDAAVDLILNVSERDGELRCALEYNRALYDAETIDRMLEHYGTLLRRLSEDPGKKITEIAFLSEAERHRMLVEWNQTDAEYPRDKCLHELFEEQVRRTPGNRAVGFLDRSLTYAELNAEANRLAQHLVALGTTVGDRVAVHLERSERISIALLAVQKCGAAYVPLDPGYPAERLRMALEDAEVRLLVTEAAIRNTLPSYDGTVVDLDSDSIAIAANDCENLATGVASSDLIYIIFTSGSTGRPKGVEVTHRNVVNYLTFSTRQIGLTSTDVYASTTSYAFDYSVAELYGPWLVGGATFVVSREIASNAEELARMLTEYGVTTVDVPPVAWGLLLEAGFTGEGLKRRMGGDSLSQDLFRRLMSAAKDTPLINEYGPTETTVGCVSHKFVSIEEQVVIGRPQANVQLYVLDAHLQPVPVGVTGRLYVAGDGVARGYLGQPDLTAQKFLPNPFSDRSRLYDTGDVVRYLADGRIEYVGRADHQVKIRGFRIELGEIETALAGHEAVRECLVIAREDEPGDRYLAAYVVPVQTDLALDIAALRAYLRDRLPDYMVPRGWVQMDRLPLAATGKVDLRNLPVPAATAAQGAEGRTLTPMEEMVASVFGEVLKLARIGVDVNFFEAGGHSLSATQVMARLRRALELEVPLRTLFEAPTVAGLAARIERLQRSELGLMPPPMIPVPRDGQLVLSFAQQRLWFLAQMDPANPMYSAPMAMRLKGRLHVEAFEQALTGLVQRHEVLRTTFLLENDEPVQVIEAASEVPLPVIDLSMMPEIEREPEAMRILEAEAQRPFMLSGDRMLRALLVRLRDEEHILLLNMHHIATDGWSSAVLMRDLSTLYANAMGVERPPLPALPIQYADYAAWQRAWLQGDVLEQQLAFWRETLAGAPPILQLPTDRPRPTEQTYNGGVHSFEVPAELMELLRKLGRREGSTSFMLLLTAFNTLMYYLVKQPDIVLGTDLANRTTVQTEDLIGFFVNLLVLRTRLSDDLTFREMLARVRAGTLDAYAHQDVPFDKLVEELQPERSHSHNPLVQVLFVQQNTPRSAGSIEGLEISGVRLAAPSKFDMAVFVRETEEGLAGIWQYNSDLFDTATIEQMASLYLVVLSQVAADAETKIGAIIDLLTDTQLQAAVSVFEESREASRSKLKRTRRAAVSL